MGSASETRNRGLAVTSVRIERDKLEAFRELAESQRRNVSQQLNHLIDRALEESEQTEAAA